MASDLDTVRVLRALFNDMPRAPQGLSHEETMAWVAQSMSDHPDGDMAYMLEHITRSSMLDIVLRLREDGYLKQDAAFDKTIELIATPEGRKTFMDSCIQAQKSSDATARLINRAKREWSDPLPLFSSDPGLVRQFVRGELSGPGPLFLEFMAREDVREIGVFAQAPDGIHEFSWGFVVEDQGAWLFYVAEVWRNGTVGGFDRFLSAWHQATTAASAERLPPVPMGLLMEDGINTFSAMTLQGAGSMSNPALRRWIGEVFIDRMLPTMAARVVDAHYDFPVESLPAH
ncbi:hypothetical protein [Hydrogenophaga sp. BPS33]|uniref:hypothetical protein n=1 Tax=Hydrogenophaga sp. BPS33 TaxID=2651974 RepID=UPI00131FC787|nr:hypothetical protein [Hydrogenophaga sp. BPS33]QHE87127.1 hypothetical protein F9K07_20610 [Hydrogenophaga sp. BPS33]